MSKYLRHAYVMGIQELEKDDDEATPTLPPKTQFTAAMNNAGILGKGGLYILQPAMLGPRSRIYKFGMTKDISKRIYSGYRHAYPFCAGGFRLMAFLVTSPDLAFKREAKLMQLSNPGHGFTKFQYDREWRQAHVKSNKEFHDKLASLWGATRTQVDGNWYIFDKTGEIVRRGGRNQSGKAEMDVSVNYVQSKPLQYTDRATRGTTARGQRLTGQTYYNPHSRMIEPTAKGATSSRRLRDIPPTNAATRFQPRPVYFPPK